MRTELPFTRAVALSAGISDDVLRGPRFVQLLRGVYVDARVDVTLSVRVRAALLLHPPGAVASHHAAAALQGLPVPHRSEIAVGVQRATHRRPRPGVLSVVIPAHAVVRRAGSIPVVSGETLFCQLAESLTLVELVVLGDAMLRRGLVSDAALVALRTHRGRASAAVRRAAALVRPDVDSPMETRLRLLLVFAGFPEPEVNKAVGPYFVDLRWQSLRLGLEYDGRQHRDDLDQWDHDIVRNEWFEREQWQLIHVVARDLHRRPGLLLARVRAAYDERGGAPFAMRSEWRAHFPVARPRP